LLYVFYSRVLSAQLGPIFFSTVSGCPRSLPSSSHAVFSDSGPLYNVLLMHCFCSVVLPTGPHRPFSCCYAVDLFLYLPLVAIYCPPVTFYFVFIPFFIPPIAFRPARAFPFYFFFIFRTHSAPKGGPCSSSIPPFFSSCNPDRPFLSALAARVCFLF